MSTTTRTRNKRALFEKFTDATPRETTIHGRLQTRENESGNVELVAYGWAKIAEYDESRGVVTVFAGHKEVDSPILTRYINEAFAVAEERRKAVLTGESPVVNKPNDGVAFVGEYVNFIANQSAVEVDAVRTVIDSIPRAF